MYMKKTDKDALTSTRPPETVQVETKPYDPWFRPHTPKSPPNGDPFGGTDDFAPASGDGK